MNGAKCFAATALEFAPGVWLDPLLESDNGFRTMFSESAFAGADSDSEFLHYCKIKYLRLALQMLSVCSIMMFGSTLNMPVGFECF